MAEYGAHITITTQEKPSIFDVTAQETLIETLQPAFKNVIKVLAEKNPSRFNILFSYADELFLCLNSLLQLHYLSSYGASFAENFYDLKRVPLKDRRKAPDLFLPRKLIAKSLIGLTLVPYIRNSLNKYSQTLEEERITVSPNQKNFTTRLKSGLRTLWPHIHLLIELITLIYYLRYLTGKSTVHSPLLQLIGVTLSRLSEDDADYIEQCSQRLTYTNIRSVKDFGLWCVDSIGAGLQNSLEFGAFFLQFLEWFYSSSNSRRLVVSSAIPPPPVKDGQILNLDASKCPICLQQRKQDTALAVSGYVFCYGCILPHVRKEGTCPVTLYPADVKQLIRIYQED